MYDTEHAFVCPAGSGPTPAVSMSICDVALTSEQTNESSATATVLSPLPADRHRLRVAYRDHAEVESRRWRRIDDRNDDRIDLRAESHSNDPDRMSRSSLVGDDDERAVVQAGLRRE